MEIPEWLKKEENYSADKEKSTFLSRSILTIGAALTRFQKIRNDEEKPEAVVFLLFVILNILLMSLSRNMLFTYILLALLIIRMCMMKEKDLAYVIHYSVRAFLISCLLLCPSIFFSHGRTMLTVSIKVFVSTSSLCMFNLSYSTSEITSCFKALHVPDVFIFTMDTTFRYIVLLSRSCEEILNALKCRLIGKSKKRDTSVTNVAGMIYVRSVHHSEEMFDAMKCRGFTGEYYNHMKFHMHKYDWFCILIMIMEFVLFVFCER